MKFVCKEHLGIFFIRNEHLNHEYLKSFSVVEFVKKYDTDYGMKFIFQKENGERVSCIDNVQPMYAPYEHFSFMLSDNLIGIDIDTSNFEFYLYSMLKIAPILTLPSIKRMFEDNIHPLQYANYTTARDRLRRLEKDLLENEGGMLDNYVHCFNEIIGEDIFGYHTWCDKKALKIMRDNNLEFLIPNFDRLFGEYEDIKVENYPTNEIL